VADLIDAGVRMVQTLVEAELAQRQVAPTL
jgi:hypothetical protein